MEQFSEITAQRAWQMICEENAKLVDVRDIQRFTYSHPKGAFHLTNQSYGEFQRQADYEQPIIVSCYHGISSRNVAAFLVEQGYDNVYSVIGGFEAWVKSALPLETAYSAE